MIRYHVHWMNRKLTVLELRGKFDVVNFVSKSHHVIYNDDPNKEFYAKDAKESIVWGNVKNKKETIAALFFGE